MPPPIGIVIVIVIAIPQVGRGGTRPYLFQTVGLAPARAYRLTMALTGAAALAPPALTDLTT